MEGVSLKAMNAAMDDVLAHSWVPSIDALESRVGDETVLLHLESGTYYGLDKVGTRMWELLKLGVGAPEMCDLIAAEYGVPQQTVQADARHFLGDLIDHAILIRAPV